MQHIPEIAIVEQNTLTALGLQTILEELIPVATIRTFPSFARLIDDTPDMYSHYFVSAQTYFEHTSFFLARRPKTIVLAAGEQPSLSGIPTLNVCLPQDKLVKAIMQMRKQGHEATHHPVSPQEMQQEHDLSPREIEVLTLITKGLINTEHQPDDGYFAPKEHHRETRYQVGFGACHLCRDARVCRSGPDMIRGTYQSSLISASGKSIFSPSTYRLECTTGLSVFIPSTQKSNDMFHVRPVPKSSVKHSFLYILVGPNSPNFRQGPQSSVIPRESPFQAGKSIRVAGTSDSGCPPLPVSSANG